MKYTVSEISNLVKLSKASIYNKINSKGFKDYITKKQGVTYINETGLKEIQEGLKDFTKEDINTLNDDTNVFKEVETDNILNEEVATGTELTKDYINTLKDNINYLKDQNEKLWNELQEKNIQLNTKDRLLENSQILLKEKPQDIKQLEEHFEELDTKLMDIREHMETQQLPKEQEHKGFFEKLFKS